MLIFYKRSLLTFKNTKIKNTCVFIVEYEFQKVNIIVLLCFILDEGTDNDCSPRKSRLNDWYLTHALSRVSKFSG